MATPVTYEQLSSLLEKKESSTSGATIAVIVIVSVLVLALIIVLVVQATMCKDSSSTVYIKKNGGDAALQAGRRAAAPAAHVRQPKSRLMQQTRGGMRAEVPPGQMPYPESYMSQFMQPTYNAPAPMPQTQLNLTPDMAVKDVYLPGVPSSAQTIGEIEMDIMTTENQGTSMNAFMDDNYMMDPGVMTPATATDVKGLQTFMPFMGGGVGDDTQNGEFGGPFDKATGLPLFTTGKLVRSQLLGGYGAGSFLRPVQDPLTGYKKTVGKTLCAGPLQAKDIEIRRKQINAERLLNKNADPILFNGSEYMYH